jgi:tRNA pseudouridine55 synthase
MPHPPYTGPDGLLVIDKPPGLTSHDVVARVRKLAGTRKVGHAGTLDPMATGVLILGIGRATRLLGHLALHDKDYSATIRLGRTTITDDAEGEVDGGADASSVDDAAIAREVAALTGDIEQVPSKVSAIKVDGQRAHRLVRAGAEVALDARPIHIARFDILDIRRVARDDGPGEFVDVDVEVTCSTGTYVRALARDVGAALGVGGHLTALRRTRVGAFNVADAFALTDDLDTSSAIVRTDDAVRRAFPQIIVEGEEETWARHGRPLPVPDVVLDPSSGSERPFTEVPPPLAVISAEGKALALVESRGGVLRPLVVVA